MMNRIRLKQKYHSGQSLVSLMLSVSLSSFLLLVILQFYSQHQQQNQEILLRLQLQTELQRVVQLMGKDLARTGFRAVSEKLTKDNLSLFEQPNQPSAIYYRSNECREKQQLCRIFYDLDANGCVGGQYKGDTCLANGRNATKEIERELFGYRLNKKNAGNPFNV